MLVTNTFQGAMKMFGIFLNQIVSGMLQILNELSSESKNPFLVHTESDQCRHQTTSFERSRCYPCHPW